MGSLVQKVIGPGLTGGVTTAATQGMAVVPAPYDSMLTSVPAVNTIASVTFPATAGKAWVVASVVWSLNALGGVALLAAQSGQIIDGVTKIFDGSLLTPPILAAGAAVDRLVLTNVAYVGSVGNAVKVTFSGVGGANTFERVSASAYLI